MGDSGGAVSGPPGAGPPGAGAPVDEPWDDWDPPPAPGMPGLHLDGYDGPLDVLLDLVERQRFDLGRISIVALVEQFVAAMERQAATLPRDPIDRGPVPGGPTCQGSAQQVPIERRAEWLILATQLLLLRSRLLFPASPRAEAAARRDAAREIERLEGMRLIRAAAAWLDARPRLGRDVFVRPPRGPDPRVALYMALMEACLTVSRGRDGDDLAIPEPAYAPARAAVFGVREALARVRARLATLTGAAPLETFLPRIPEQARDRELVARSAVGSTFLAALELARTAEVALEQSERFGTLMIQAP